LHIKTAIPLLHLYEITKDQNLLGKAVKILDSFSQYKNADGSFKLHQNDEIINLHTLCYALEGLMFGYYLTKNDKYLKICSEAANWCIQQIEKDGSIKLWYNSKYKTKAAYSTAQLIRLMILLDKINNNNYKKYISKLYSFLISLQANSSNSEIDGGFYEELYKFGFSWKKRQRLNSWTSMFALQALHWYENYEQITFEKGIKNLF